MKKNWLVTQIFLGTILTVVAFPAFSASEKLVDVQQFALEQQRANLRAQEEAARQHEETVSRSTMATNQTASATENKKNAAQTSNAANRENNNAIELSKKNLPTCNCYDPNSVYNYPDNYFYDAQRNKTYQIKPACECLRATPAVTTEQMPATVEPQKDYVESKDSTSKDTSTKNDWGIRYR